MSLKKNREGGGRLYHAGGTNFIPEMKGLKVDIALLLPVSRTYIMESDEAVGCTCHDPAYKDPPMHYDIIVRDRENAVHFKNALNKKIKVTFLPAPRIVVDRRRTDPKCRRLECSEIVATY